GANGFADPPQRSVARIGLASSPAKVNLIVAGLHLHKTRTRQIFSFRYCGLAWPKYSFAALSCPQRPPCSHLRTRRVAGTALRQRQTRSEEARGVLPGRGVSLDNQDATGRSSLPICA